MDSMGNSHYHMEDQQIFEGVLITFVCLAVFLRSLPSKITMFHHHFGNIFYLFLAAEQANPRLSFDWNLMTMFATPKSAGPSRIFGHNSFWTLKQRQSGETWQR